MKKHTFNSILVVLFLLLSVIPLQGDARNAKVSAAQCRESRRMVSGSIEIYYIEYPETYGMITIDMLLRSGALTEMPYCPGGGEYSIDANGEVYCSMHQPNPSLQPVIQQPVEPIAEEPPPVVENYEEQLTEDNPFVRTEEIQNTSDIIIEEEPEVVEEPLEPTKPQENRLVTAHDLGSTNLWKGDLASEASKVDFSEIVGAAKKNPATKKKEKEEKTFVTAYDYNVEGMSLSSKMDFDQAVKKFQKALDLAPDSKIYLYNIALAFSRTGKFEKAKYHIDRAFRLDPSNQRVKKLHELISSRIEASK